MEVSEMLGLVMVEQDEAEKGDKSQERTFKVCYSTLRRNDRREQSRIVNSELG